MSPNANLQVHPTLGPDARYSGRDSDRLSDSRALRSARDDPQVEVRAGVVMDGDARLVQSGFVIAIGSSQLGHVAGGGSEGPHRAEGDPQLNRVRNRAEPVL